MGADLSERVPHPSGEQPEVEEWSAVADTFAGRVHIEWDTTAPVTPLGQLPFFIEYLKQGGLFDGWVADCPLLFTSPNAPRKRDVLGTLLLPVLAGHRRYAHYGAAKAAIAHYTRYLAQDLGPFGITVNCIAPGVIATARINGEGHSGRRSE